MAAIKVYLEASGRSFYSEKIDRQIEEITSELDPEKVKAFLDGLDSYYFIGTDFRDVIEPSLKQVYGDGWEDGKTRLETFVDNEIILDFPEMRAADWADKHAGELITKIDESTRGMIRETIESSTRAGEDYFTLKARLMENYGFSEARAECIAKTEDGFAYNTGAVDAWQESGLARAIWCEDGDGDDECEPFAGVELSFEEAKANPIGHPNCTREFFPIFKESNTG